ncbi:glycogen debranching protein [Dokdonia sinensis]|uniref:Glycogen debranching protein n=1 Tax=Dokdonia sinensis TaxID=2479847 RepID=A0A3M0G426_9FLAO|nr:glycogen debranching protein [Dokdonia sinensis]RMB56942.1 glycogen debranching protein [Dokdonia sinensis]
MRSLYLLFIVAILISCTKQESHTSNIAELLKDSPSITGKTDYLNSPMVTAGDRVYMVGHQDGSFPELGWHIKDEMGGIWNHPIKLMDGFDVGILKDGGAYGLNEAKQFTNYPFANKHSYTIEEANLNITRWQFVPDGKEGIFIQFKIDNTSNELNSFELDFIGIVDLRPTWLGEETGMINAKDSITYNREIDAFVSGDVNNPWFVVFGANQKSLNQIKYILDGQQTGELIYPITIPANGSKTISFVIAGSYHSQDEAMATYESIHENSYAFAKAKKERYATLANQTKLTIPDKKIEQAFEWLKYNSDWLIQEVPEIGRGITAGIPDYPWWFGVDSEYALKGYMAIGQTDAVYSTIALLDSVSNAINGNGRILHEMSTNGAVFNKGNINETPQFASLIWNTYRWNGDREFLERYFPTIKKGLEWLMTEKDKDGNGFPDGFGMMEIHGLDSEMIDVAVYTQRAFDDASKITRVLGMDTLSRKYAQTAQTLKDKINTEFWSEEFQSYADFIGTDKQALHLIEDAIVRADTLNKPWAVAELKATKKAILKNPSSRPRPFVLHHNWVVNTPMEMGIAPPDKAKKALQTAERFVNPFGVFVTGIDRDESAGTDDGSFKGSKQFSYTGAVMTLPTAVQIIGENNYGNPDKALDYLKRMTRSFSYALPGSMYEVSPDYGMITQAWNIYGYAVPIVEQFFGIQPDGASKTIYINPQMPSTWKTGSLENVQVGDTSISVFYDADKPKNDTLKVVKHSGSWKVIVGDASFGFVVEND